jgi:copper homeostasis protein CutC
MGQRDATVQWLKDTLEHLCNHQQQLEWTVDAETTRVLTEAMIRDLERCQRLCEALHRRCLAQVMRS